MYNNYSSGNYSGNYSGNSNTNYNSNNSTFNREKSEEELAIHIRKALTVEESAPKQKHVRACIVYTWDSRGSGSFWRAVKSFPSLGDEIVTFKLLITIHKVIRQGHDMVLKDGCREQNFIENLARNTSSYGGYSDLIKAYVKFLLVKLDYHSVHPEFNGNFDYEDYVSLKGVSDPNDGYHTIEELLEMLNKIDTLEKLVFQNLRPTSNNEARIAALVPLVEESYSIYEFLVSMMTAMHQIIGSVEILSPLRTQFKRTHYSLLQFYENCKGLKYLTSLISVPNLPHDPPDFLIKGPPTIKPKAAKSLEKEQEDDERFNQEQEKIRQQLLLEQAQQKQARDAELARIDELDRQRREYEHQRQEAARLQELERVRMEEERTRLMQQQAHNAANMELQQYHNRLLESHAHIKNLQNQSLQDKDQIAQYQLKTKQLEDQMAILSLRNDDDTIKKLTDELNSWKQKYEALAKLYSQLRKEHLDLLTKFKEMKESGSDKTRAEVEKIQQELKAKTNELNELIYERDRYKNDAERIRNQSENELMQLRKDLKDARESLLEVSKTKGSEVSAMVSKFNLDKAELESILRSKVSELDVLKRQLEDALHNSNRSEAKHKDEINVLQAGLDQTLLAFAQQQQNSLSLSQDWEAKLQKMKLEQLEELNKMLDQILIGSHRTIEDAIFQMESPAFTGNQGATPEFVLSVLEKTQAACADFGNSLMQVTQGSDPKDAINPANAFTQAVIQLCYNVKGVSRLAEDDLSEKIMKLINTSSVKVKDFLQKSTSAALSTLPLNSRKETITNFSREAQENFSKLGQAIETLVNKDGSVINADADLGDLVEREMRNVAKAIEEAALRLQNLMIKPKEGVDLNVHGAILQAAMAITSAVGNLIKCATAAEQEIVSQGRGAASKVAFYKKNNKWTEGLISAAKSVAISTTWLVEVADGLVNGTHSWEQLVVAAQDVSVATTQLVAASRVKSVAFSKTQDKLEMAAVSVREATQLLVKAAKEASKHSAEQRALEEIKKVGRHEFKVQEMEQQVRILEIEKDLQTARYKLAGIRKQGYSE